VPLLVTEEMLAAARAELPELPADRAARFRTRLQAERRPHRNFARRAELGDYFQAAVATLPDCSHDGNDGWVAVAKRLEQLVERISSDVRSFRVEGLVGERCATAKP
jgi:Asp-tRNA(Asn)/Glu-tRNA(Gln) amidotransferase B subunit